MPRKTALLMSGFLQLWFLVASSGTWFLIEKMGRRRSFIFSATGMAIVMFIMAAMLAIGTQKTGIVAAVMIFMYQAFYTWGFMGGVWVSHLRARSFRVWIILTATKTYGPEIIPLEYRTKGTGLATGTLWLFAFVIVEVVPIGIDNIHWKMFLIFGIFNLIYIPIVYFLFPETAGFSLEMVDMCFMDPNTDPVKKSKELHRAMKSGEALHIMDEHQGKIEKATYVERVEVEKK